MEISTPRKRGPYRKTRERADSVLGDRQPSAFPSQSSEPLPARIEENAAEKNKVLDAVNKIPDIFTPEDVAWFFDVYVGLLCYVYSIVLKTDFKALYDELEFKDSQKKDMAVPLSKILSKTVPASWAGLKNEIQLIGMLGVYTVVSFKRAQMVANKEVEKKKDAERTQPVAPMNRQRADVHVPA